MAGSRSPNYPQLSLTEAIEKLRDLRRNIGDQRERSPKELAAAMDYSDLNGAAQGVISALRKYGLLSGKQGALAVSQQAIDILHLPPGSAGRTKALEQAILGYPLFRELLAAEAAGEGVLLHHRLVSQGFSDKAADRLLEIHRLNLLHVEKEGGSLASPSPTPATAAVPVPSGERQSGSQPEDRRATALSTDELAFEVELTYGSTRVTVSARGNGAPIAPEVIRLLQDLISLAGSKQR